jgi:hypothetical protein
MADNQCPFCAAGIAHREHVPASQVRVGQDYGETERGTPG